MGIGSTPKLREKRKFVVFYNDSILFIDGDWLFVKKVKEIKYKDVRSVDYKLEPFNREPTEQLQITINYGNKQHKFGLPNWKYNIKFAKYLKQKVEDKHQEYTGENNSSLTT